MRLDTENGNEWYYARPHWDKGLIIKWDSVFQKWIYHHNECPVDTNVLRNDDFHESDKYGNKKKSLKEKETKWQRE